MIDLPEEAVEAARAACGTTREWATLAVEAAAPAIEEKARKQEQERLLDGLREWLGSDHEYEVLAAIHADLKANPQLVPEVDVPLRLLQALRAAMDRFSSLEDPDD